MTRAPGLFPAAATALAVLLAAPAVAFARVDLPRHGDRSVYDLAGIVSAEHAESMERTHRELWDKTGVQLAVVTLPRLDGDALEEVLTRAGPEWGLGRTAEDRGIVIALAMEEHRVLIATGHGVEDFLPDDRVRMVIQRFIIPRLQRNEPSFAVLNASSALIAAASRRYAAEVKAPAAASADNRRAPARSWETSLIVILFVLGLALRPAIGRLFAWVPRAAPSAGRQ
jgi:uncharacterized protein